MINLEVETKLPQAEVIRRMKSFFAKGGLGLEIREETEACLTFEGGGGYVTATLCQEEEKIRVNLVGQEWDYQIKEFLSTLPK